MADVLLFRPRCTSRTDSRPTPPWGLLHVADRLVEQGADVTLIDECCTPEYSRRVEEALARRPVAVGISSMSGEQLRHALEFAAWARKHSRAPIVWGGAHVTLRPEESVQHECVDYAVAGEGDWAFPELVNCLARGEGAPDIPGVYYLRNGKPYGAPQEQFVDLPALPPVPYDLLDIERYIGPRPDLGIARCFELCTSRGCPHACAFCYAEAVHRRRWRPLPAERVLEQLADLKRRFQVDGVLFREDNFFVNPHRVEAIAQGMVSHGLGMRWAGNCRIDYFERYDAAFIGLLKQSGCALLTFGVESGNDRVLKFMKKGITVAQVLAVAQRLRDARIAATYHFMGGLPGETEAEFLDTCLLIDRLIREDAENRAVARELAVFGPYPGLVLTEEAVKRGYVLPDRLEGWTDLDWWSQSARPWLTRRHMRLLSDAQFLIARLSHAQPWVRAWIRLRWRQLLRTRRPLLLPERTLASRVSLLRKCAAPDQRP